MTYRDAKISVTYRDTIISMTYKDAKISMTYSDRDQLCADIYQQITLYVYTLLLDILKQRCMVCMVLNGFSRLQIYRFHSTCVPKLWGNISHTKINCFSISVVYRSIVIHMYQDIYDLQNQSSYQKSMTSRKLDQSTTADGRPTTMM